MENMGNIESMENLQQEKKEFIYQELNDQYTIQHGEVLVLVLKEQSIINMLWECELPSEVKLIKKHKTFENLVDTVYWELTSDEPGTYWLTFEYRKQCCGRFLKEAKTIELIVE